MGQKNIFWSRISTVILIFGYCSVKNDFLVQLQKIWCFGLRSFGPRTAPQCITFSNSSSCPSLGLSFPSRYPEEGRRPVPSTHHDMGSSPRSTTTATTTTVNAGATTRWLALAEVPQHTMIPLHCSVTRDADIVCTDRSIPSTHWDWQQLG